MIPHRNRPYGVRRSAQVAGGATRGDQDRCRLAPAKGPCRVGIHSEGSESWTPLDGWSGTKEAAEATVLRLREIGIEARIIQWEEAS